MVTNEQTRSRNGKSDPRDAGKRDDPTIAADRLLRHVREFSAYCQHYLQVRLDGAKHRATTLALLACAGFFCGLGVTMVVAALVLVTLNSVAWAITAGLDWPIWLTRLIVSVAGLVCIGLGLATAWRRIKTKKREEKHEKYEHFRDRQFDEYGRDLIDAARTALNVANHRAGTSSGETGDAPDEAGDPARRQDLR